MCYFIHLIVYFRTRIQGRRLNLLGKKTSYIFLRILANCTVDVTITSCEPTVTNCPYKGGAGDGADHTWSDWVSASTTSSKPVKPVTTSSYYDPSWSDWESTTSSKPVKPATTSTYYDPSWSDWETTTSTPVKPATTTYDPSWSDWAATTTLVSSPYVVSATGVSPASYSSSATPVKPAVATYTGAANANAGSFAFAGLVAAAALVIA